MRKAYVSVNGIKAGVLEELEGKNINLLTLMIIRGTCFSHHAVNQ